MSFWSNFKAKRKYKADLRAYNEKLAEWQQDAQIFQKCLDAIYLLAKGKDAADDSLQSNPGELTLWVGNGRALIPARSPSRYVGGSSGFSIPITKGVRYRVSGSRGTLVQGDPYLAEADPGEVVLTTERLVFNGSINSQEWLFSRWTGATTDPTSQHFTFNVSNRKKTSGLAFDHLTGKEFNRFLSVALKIHEDGLPDMIEQMKEIIKKNNLEEPKPPAQILAPKQVKAIEG